jgi:hypothetical protein
MPLRSPGILTGYPFYSFLEIQQFHDSNKLFFYDINPLKHEFYYNFNFYLTENTLSFHYKYQSVNTLRI